MVSTCKHNYSDSIQHSYTRHLPSVQNFRLGEGMCMLPKGYRACFLYLVLTQIIFSFHSPVIAGSLVPLFYYTRS